MAKVSGTSKLHRAALSLSIAGAVLAIPAFAGWTPGVTGGSPAARPGAPAVAAIARAAAVYSRQPARPITSASPAVVAGLQRLATTATAAPAWSVGFDKESVDPTPAMIAAGFHLGGYGLGPTRQTTGPLVDGDGTVEHIYARAMAVSNGSQTMLLAALENQGTFAAYKEGPYGLWDIRVRVSRDTGVPVDDIVIDSDHSHAGPDLIGLWGGVPVAYMREVFNQTVRALEIAEQHRVPAFLRVGTEVPVVPDPTTGGYLAGTATPGEDFDHSQFSPDTGSNPPGLTGYDDSLVDTQLRVLQAVDATGHPLGTLINYAAHATVMGGGNTGYSADWPGRVARATEVALGEPVALTMVADVGRTQPPRPHSDAACGSAGHPSCDVDQLDTWTRLFTPWVLDAVAGSVPVQGTAIAGDEVFTREAATNPALLGVSVSGEAPARGFGAYRGATEPWMAGAVIGTFASAHRIGNLLLTANPGEVYPDVRFAVSRSVKGVQAFFTFGLANDQLGYLIAPASEYPWIVYSNVGNDNAFFNVSAQYGDHLFCTEKAAAHAIGFAGAGALQPYGPGAAQPNCAALTASDAAGMGPVTQQPWVFGDGVEVPAPPAVP